MNVNTAAKMTRSELMECISNRKSEIAHKLETGETEPAFAIGAESYTCKEWDNLIRKFDKTLDAIKEEQEQRKEAMEEEEKKEPFSVSLLEPETVKRNYFMEKINGTYKGPSVPYEYLAKDGVINYKGVIFTCNSDWNAICLGDMSNRKNVLTIPLTEGGCLMVNRDNFGDLSQAITMFSPEDQNRILRAIADDKKAQSAQNEIEEDKNSIGDDAEENVLDDDNPHMDPQMEILNQLTADQNKEPKEPSEKKRV